MKCRYSGRKISNYGIIDDKLVDKLATNFLFRLNLYVLCAKKQSILFNVF